ncbi:MAG: acyltransferase [Candidatus Heimdallarchaeota archaeon]|nr:acyltransferase [Candidatus Heimdallarchaeota archaeon]
MKVGFIQFKPIFGDISGNIRRSLQLIRKTADADLLVLPELCTTGYLFEKQVEVQELAEVVPSGETTQRLMEVAEETNTFLVAGICEKGKNNKYYNSAVLLGPKGFIDVYRKVHLFDKEKLFFSPGTNPFKIYDIGQAKIGILICFDWIFPEATRVLALKGAEIICHPANLVLPYAQKTMLARSIENRVFTITANRIGREQRPNSSLTFTGQSQITSPKMELLVSASPDREEVHCLDIDPSIARDKKVTENNDIFNDRRIDLYTSLLKKHF